MLADFLQSISPTTVDEVVWGDLRLRVAAHVHSELPPAKYVTSARCLVWRNASTGRQVLVVRDPDGIHVLPGGRCKADETFEQTARREVLEETGWRIGALQRLGFIHYQHVTPRPPDYPYPYPDFVQVVYHAVAETFAPAAREVDGYEIGAAFQPVAPALLQRVSSGDRAYLAALGAIHV